MMTEHTGSVTEGVPTEDELRQRAIKRLRAKAGFWTHLVVYLAVNAFLVVIWAFTGSDLFWPVFPIVGWGIGVAANA
jgi:2TM domain